MSEPKKAREVLNLAIDNGWAAGWQPGEDSVGSPFVTVQGRKGHAAFVVTWHTRETGTYRLLTCMTGAGISAGHVTLKKLIEYIEAQP